MLLHLNFCIEWFELNSKEDSKSFGKCFEILEKEKEKGFSLLISVLAQLAARQRAASACPPACGPLLLFPASRLGRAQPAAWLVRARAFLPSPSLTLRVHKSGPPPSSSRRQRGLPNTSPIEFPPQSLLSLFRAPPGYKSRMPHPSTPSCTEAEDRHRPEEATLEP
jgi:hypothetical protein